jgi:hypothetical protein
MKLLIEKSGETTNEIAENNYFIKGIFLQSGIVNQNKRVYSTEILEREVNKYIKEKVEKNRAVGELGHPEMPSMNLDRVSHKIISLEKDGGNYIGKAKIMTTPFGNIVRSLMDENVEFGVSSRGLGSLKEDGNVNYVCDDYHLITPADIVYEPSAPDAWVTGLRENREWAWENGKLIEKETQVKKMINESTKKDLFVLFDELLKLID